jgi:hypothetical protein
MIPGCTCVRWCTIRGRAPCPHWPPPVEQTDPAARRVAWILWGLAAVIVVGLFLYAWSSK